jgi:hypothetical protein
MPLSLVELRDFFQLHSTSKDPTAVPELAVVVLSEMRYLMWSPLLEAIALKIFAHQPYTSLDS